MSDQARPIERARFLSGEAFPDDERRGRPSAQEPRGERQRKAHRRRPVRRPSGRDLMQGIVRKPAAESGVEHARERQAPRGPLAWPAGLRLDLSDGAPETRHPLRSAAWRHPARFLYVRIMFLFWTRE